ncbi:hypothetical protein F5X68DRAFT_238597 [Plectosphaerella plurivora]|uniref:Uncharacterized protein n=1 Tax=Plectosphaerella plurivora TaxID=936078 RepID=A0A9P9AH16_9PEZI|nr:hypothetical protein F5X68DRAFT_238597 [Plectosphaerella plurivora]
MDPSPSPAEIAEFNSAIQKLLYSPSMEPLLAPETMASFESMVETALSMPSATSIQLYQFWKGLHAAKPTGNPMPPPPPPPERAELISLFEKFLSSPSTTPMAVHQLRLFFNVDRLLGLLGYPQPQEAQAKINSPGSMEKSEFIALIDGFIASPPIPYASIRQAREFLTDFTPTESAQTFPPDISQRLELARRVEKQLREAGASSSGEASSSYRNFRMNLMQLSTFLAADTETLQVIESLTHDTWESSALFLESIEGFLKTFLVSREDRVLSEKEHKHMSPAIEGAIARDNRICAFTKSCGFLLCIWPLRLDDTEPVSEDSRKTITGLLGTISPKLFSETEKLLFGRDSDGNSVMLSSHWNIITASLQFFPCHWARAQLALEPLKITTTMDEKCVSLRVKWHWMPKSLAQALKSHGNICSAENPGLKDPWLSADLEAEDLATIIKDTLDYHPGDATVRTDESPWAFLQSGRQIQTGMCFELRVAKDDAHKMEAFLQAQWTSPPVCATEAMLGNKNEASAPEVIVGNKDETNDQLGEDEMKERRISGILKGMLRAVIRK